MSVGGHTTSCTYENRLRVIGSKIEALEIRDIALFEIAGGFIVRGARGALDQAEAFEFPDEQFPNLVQAAHDARGDGDGHAYHPPLLPTGYADFLRAVGCELDEMVAKSVTIYEMEAAFVVSGLAPVESASGRMTYQRFERFLGENEISSALDQAFHRRSSNGFFARRARLKALGR